jgi:hypothetical protein
MIYTHVSNRGGRGALSPLDSNERSRFAADIAKRLSVPTDLKCQDAGDWLALRNRILDRESALIQQVLRAGVFVLS